MYGKKELNGDRTYMCIDMKCFYASVECAERQLNPFETCLVSLDGLVRNDLTMVIASMPMDAADCEPEGLIEIMQENAKKTGKKGERLVVALEKADLKDLPFANAVTDAPAHETGTHFDVLSFSKDGETKYVEVKSTQYA